MFLLTYPLRIDQLETYAGKTSTEIKQLPEIPNFQEETKESLIPALDELWNKNITPSEILISTEKGSISAFDLFQAPKPNSVIRLTKDPSFRTCIAMGVVLSSSLTEDDLTTGQDFLPLSFWQACQIEEDDITYVLKTLGDSPRAKVCSLFDTARIDILCPQFYYPDIKKSSPNFCFGFTKANLSKEGAYYTNTFQAFQIHVYDRETEETITNSALGVYDLETGELTDFIVYYFPNTTCSIPYTPEPEAKKIVSIFSEPINFSYIMEVLLPEEDKTKYKPIINKASFCMTVCSAHPYWITLLNMYHVGAKLLRKFILAAVKRYLKAERRYRNQPIEEYQYAKDNKIPTDFRALKDMLHKTSGIATVICLYLAYMERDIFS